MAVATKGSQKNDKWIGDAQNNVFNGLAGNDICIAGAGADKVFAGLGNDIIKGGEGDDTLDGGAGNDKIQGNGGNDTLSGKAGDDRILGGDGDDSVFGGAGNDRIAGGNGDDSLAGDAGNDVIAGDLGDDNISGGSGNDLILGGDGSDFLAGDSGIDKIFGDTGDDTIEGGEGNDILDGGDGNDSVSGNEGDDRMLGGTGDDVLDWDDGDGNDVMSGNDGRDTIEVNGSVTQGDNFVLGKNAQGLAFFERVGLDGQLGVGLINLTVDTSEVFDVFGEIGNDTFVVNDLTGTGVELIKFDGGEGNDSIDARNSSTRIEAIGGNGDDILTGGTGTITTINPNTNLPVTLGDSLTGGVGKDKFQFLVDPFAGKPQNVNLQQPDVITDYEQGGIDQMVFGKAQFKLNELRFQQGDVTQLQDGNLLVLTGSFVNAGAAAKAVADNNTITSKEGLFVYFNSTLGFSRVVYSTDLANNGVFSVQANLTSLKDANVQNLYNANDFALA